ncbi:MAG: glycosyltransferase [Nitrospira sp.]
MKICFLVPRLTYGGSERQMVVLAKGLHARGHDVVVVGYYSGGPLQKDLRDAGIRIRSTNKCGRWDVRNFLFRLIKIMREERPDILYCALTELVAMILKRVFPRTKVVWTIRASNLDLRNYDWLTRVYFKLECRLSRFADAIISNSHAGRDYHLALGYPAERTVVIPNGIDTEWFRPDLGARHHVRSEWGIQDHEQVIGIVGRLDPVKDHPTFLHAASLLALKRKHLRFVCMGEGPATYRESLHQLTRSLKLTEHVIWLNGRSDMPNVYNALDLLVSSSISEGLSNVIAEALACGIPCVVTNVGDSAWVVGSSGMIVPPKDPEVLADAMSRMVAAPKPDPTTIRRRILEHLSADALVIATEQALLRLCHQPTGTCVASRENTPVC